MKKLKPKFKFKKVLLISCVFVFSFLVFRITNAANLYFEPAQGNYAKGDTFIENLILDTEDETINVVETKISYPAEILEVKEISTGNSILELWTNQPFAVKGVVSFTGGKPDGYKGKDGKIISIAFKVLKNGEAEIKVGNDTKVLLNDGKGTEAKLTLKSAFINTSGSKISGDEWEKLLKSDKTPPLPFKIKLSKDPSLFGNQYFISFATTDKETGIDYYEVLESPLTIKSNKVPSWKKTESPYLLQDQSLQSEIIVKAVDKAGNERMVKFNPRDNKKSLIVFFVFTIFIAIFLFFFAKRRKKHSTINSF